MIANVAPSFDVLERLGQGHEADLINFVPISRSNNRGRGAQSNRSGRFEKTQRETFDDGWASDDPEEKFETIEHMERATSIITRNSSPDLHFDRSINPYRGCAHGCSYCYARPTHTYLGHSAGLDFERDIYIKPNAAALLRKELSHSRYRAKTIAIGTNTDPYQPAERKHKIMRQLLEVFCETKHPVMITTKSALIVRDLDLLSELARQNLVFVTMSITSMDHKLSRWMEPRASTPIKRLEAVKILSEAGITTNVLAAPMIPAINDMELERIIENSAAQGATGVQMIMLRLPGEVLDIFREWLLRYYPNKVSHVMNLVRDMRNGKENDSRFGWRMRGQGPYAQMLEQRFEQITKKLGLNKKPPVLCCDLFEPPETVSDQLSLF
ncbi:MAG: PA0069 family radical SAM protein [Devosiaceae bacterium]|nr:PA0069 family radical SAM protein [Devosiaceae bacterium]